MLKCNKDQLYLPVCSSHKECTNASLPWLQTRFDLTIWAGVLLILVVDLFVFGICCTFYYSYVTDLLYGCLGALLYSLVRDTGRCDEWRHCRTCPKDMRHNHGFFQYLHPGSFWRIWLIPWCCGVLWVVCMSFQMDSGWSVGQEVKLCAALNNRFASEIRGSSRRGYCGINQHTSTSRYSTFLCLTLTRAFIPNNSQWIQQQNESEFIFYQLYNWK